MYTLSIEIITLTLKVAVTKKQNISETGLNIHIVINIQRYKFRIFPFHLAYQPLALGDLEGHSDVTNIKKII